LVRSRKAKRKFRTIRPWGMKDGLLEGILIFTEDITARKQAEMELRESRDLLQLFIDHAPVSLAMFDREMRYLAASRRHLEEFGLVGREVIGHSHYEIFPNLPEHWKEAHRRGLAGESSSCDELHLKEWIGADIWGRWEVHPWYRADGAVGGIVLFTQNLTDIKQTEERLRESEEELREAQHIAGLGSIVVDSQTRQWEGSDVLDHIFGIDPSYPHTEEGLKALFHPDDLAEIDRMINEDVFGQGKPFDIEYRIVRHNDKALRWIHGLGRVEFDAQGRPIKLRGTLQDITERKQIEEMLQESEATTRALLETAAQAIVAVDASGGIVMANRMAGKMFGYTPGKLLGRQLEILIPERLQELHRAHRADFYTNPRSRTVGSDMDLIGLRRDGSEFPIEVSLSSVDTKQGPLAVAFVSDITGRKEAERALLEREEKLRVLAGSLLSAQEEERRKLALELHDDITQQLAFLSIELGRLASEMPSSVEKERKQLQTLQKQTLRASSEVRRISHGLHPSVIHDFGLSVALEEFCEEFERAQGIRVVFEGPVEDSKLHVSGATCLYRIAQESLRNAAIHGHATQINVSLTAGHGIIHLRVADNGIGFSADPTRSKTGLGVISMVERIRLVNGTLNLSSQPGHGTEITASVPLKGVHHETRKDSGG